MKNLRLLSIIASVLALILAFVFPCDLSMMAMITTLLVSSIIFLIDLDNDPINY